MAEVIDLEADEIPAKNHKHQHQDIEVRTARGYWDRRVQKLQEQKATAVGAIFKGVNVYFNGRMADLSAFELGKLIESQGGSATPLFSKEKVTHVVCVNLSGVKTDKAIRQLGTRWSVPFVHPDWITQSCMLGRRLPESDYTVIKETSMKSITAFFAPQDTGGSDGGGGTKANEKLVEGHTSDDRTRTVAKRTREQRSDPSWRSLEKREENMAEEEEEENPLHD
mmetsp:Transcript_12848/g.21006  ORF Transcript_12848/g.21006 Transcript_12848/m.21006 type:complete len:224 (+) Transcript_12848:218-889(+)